MDMNKDLLSDQLTDLLTKLKKGHRVDMGKVIHSLSDVEREIFMKAMDQKNKKQRDEFEEMIKDKYQLATPQDKIIDQLESDIERLKVEVFELKGDNKLLRMQLKECSEKMQEQQGYYDDDGNYVG